MRALILGLLACSSANDQPPQPTTPCGQSVAVVGGAIEATLAAPDAESFRLAAELAPLKDCAGVPELVDDWAAYLTAPEPARKRELLERLEGLAAQHRWVPPASWVRTIQAAKSRY